MVHRNLGWLSGLGRAVMVGVIVLAFAWAANASAQSITIEPSRDRAIYRSGDTVIWTVRHLSATTQPATRNSGDRKSTYSYAIKRNNAVEVAKGEVDLTSGEARISFRETEPGMLYLQVTTPTGRKYAAGAVVSPTEIKPVVAEPKDFDEFWQAQIAKLKEVPPDPVLTPKDSGVAGVDYATIRMHLLAGSGVHGQLARPKEGKKFPAIVIFQWASPPYPLQKPWVTDHAKNGWLALNIEPHDVKPDEPQAYYDALPNEIKNYATIGMDDREKSYFREMYLRTYRAVEYTTSRPDWDGKTIVVLGTSMGGQQAFAAAGLHPAVTHLIVNEPAGCDMQGPLHGRQIGYPFFPPDNLKVMEVSGYFDAVNFAARVKAQSLVAMGFVDTVAPPAGIWTAYNQVKGPKEAVALFDSPHNHHATPAQQQAFYDRSQAWLSALVKGQPAPIPVGHRQVGFDDHQNMLQQLGIRELRPGTGPNDPKTFDQGRANQYLSTVPPILVMKDGGRVTSAEQWARRRAELIEVFEREVYGRIPANVPKIAWEVRSTSQGESDGIPTVTRVLAGRVDNSAYPDLSVEIQATYTVPANAAASVPIVVEISPGRRLRLPTTQATTQRAQRGIPWTQQAIANGWGYASLSAYSIQPDNDQLTSGIIGLTNRGRPRAPEQWGALRAWAWGVSRLVDYFEADEGAKVDPKRVAVVGVSRFGKAALVAQAFDERIAVGFIGSSGAGGAKLLRHQWGEAVENLTSNAEYHWFAGNFLKYAGEDPKRTTADLPVDAHQLIALCAPRPCLISYGVPEKGDAEWVDARGSWMATQLASEVYELLGTKGLGVKGGFSEVPMPAVNQLVGGTLAWRQHDGGHEVTPNWPTFFAWTKEMGIAMGAPTEKPPVVGVARQDANSQLAHRQLVAKAKAGRIDLYFLGDSITRRWGTSDVAYADFYSHWKETFHGWNAGNFGWGGDTTRNILWRIENGELEGVAPKVIVVLAGTNDVGAGRAGDVVPGVEAILRVISQKAPGARVVLMGVLPRRDKPEYARQIREINYELAARADGQRVLFVDVTEKLTDSNGKLRDEVTVDGLHLSLAGYRIWGDALVPVLESLLGPRAAVDLAPPPTGDPSVAR